MNRAILLYLITLFGAAQAQVLDVNGDQVVGPEEAIAISENWKGPASAANDHNHLGQVWTPVGSGAPLILRGDFPDRFLIPKESGDGKIVLARPSAPLILENTIEDRPDLMLGGDKGIIGAIGNSSSALELRSNASVIAVLDANQGGSLSGFEVRNAAGDLQGGFTNTGFLFVAGNGFIGGELIVVDGISMKRPVDKSGGDSGAASFFALSGPQPTDIYNGKTVLDENGEAEVSLPEASSSDYSEFLYQLTSIGGAAPGLHVAEEVEGGRFRIAGGLPGLTVCWQVTGILDR